MYDKIVEKKMNADLETDVKAYCKIPQINTQITNYYAAIRK